MIDVYNDDRQNNNNDRLKTESTGLNSKAVSP